MSAPAGYEADGEDNDTAIPPLSDGYDSDDSDDDSFISNHSPGLTSRYESESEDSLFDDEYLSLDEDGDDDFIGPQVAASYGLAFNENGGMFKRGSAYDITKKLAVCAVIRQQGSSLNMAEVARRCSVSWGFVCKVWEEMLENDGRVIDPSTVRQGRMEGPGANSLTEYDHFALMYLYFEEPSRSNASYVENLFQVTGTKVSRSTISRWFNNFFPISGRFRKPNMVPVDKFKPINLIKAEEYIVVLEKVAPNKLRFGDEKLIKGSEVYCRRTRRNVFNGELFKSA
jgi:hypothetical protein